MSSAEAIQMWRERGSICAWRGCGETCGHELPIGWTYLITHWAPHPILDVAKMNMTRDAVLCPQHAFALERTLKDLGRH
jgi:hypothetical protein